MRALIDELTNLESREVIMRKKLRFGSGISLDLSSLIVAGHSFGGMTAIETAVLEPERVKTCITMDPWLFTRHQAILNKDYRLI